MPQLEFTASFHGDDDLTPQDLIDASASVQSVVYNLKNHGHKVTEEPRVRLGTGVLHFYFEAEC